MSVQIWLRVLVGAGASLSLLAMRLPWTFSIPARATVRPPREPARAAKRKRATKPATPAVGYYWTVSAGVPLHVVQVDPRRPEVRIRVVTAQNGIGTQEDWSTLIGRARPVAAVNGTYFCVRSRIPVGAIITGRRTICGGSLRTALACDPGRSAKVLACRRDRARRWSKHDMVLQAGPRLLTTGRQTLWPHDEGFRDPAVFACKRRTAVALTRQGKLLLLATQKPVLLRTLAASLKALGAVDAMCLDGGSSTGLYYGGKTRVRPGRQLTNLLVVDTGTAGRPLYNL